MAKKVTRKKTTKKTAKKAPKKTARKKSTKKTTKKSTSNKTVATKASVAAFLKKAPAKFGGDCEQLVKIMSAITKEEPKMWGPSIVGFGSYHYVYESGREGDMPLLGFSPRASALSIYVMGGFEPYEAELEKLGKHKTGKGCLYIKSLEDIHLPTLKKILRANAKRLKSM